MLHDPRLPAAGLPTARVLSEEWRRTEEHEWQDRRIAYSASTSCCCVPASMLSGLDPCVRACVRGLVKPEAGPGPPLQPQRARGAFSEFEAPALPSLPPPVHRLSPQNVSMAYPARQQQQQHRRMAVVLHTLPIGDGRQAAGRERRGLARRERKLEGRAENEGHATHPPLRTRQSRKAAARIAYACAGLCAQTRICQSFQ